MPFGLRAGRHCPGLSVAGQGGTGDPRLRDPHKAIRFAGASQAPPSRGWHVASCRPVPLLPTCSGHPATFALPGRPLE